ncbi:MAG TPA: c-type cytochrome biogenesis protein CcsB [Candidatus Deferrimicrobium sp.]|nr:c-type cytochrome biogenesis protein CcsB [Candidatus Deferrimicrobium sp.]
MATISQYLFVSGALLLLFAFVAAVAFTTLLAVGRRAAAGLVAGTSPVATATLAGGTRLADVPGAQTLSAIGHGLTWASFLLLSGSLATRAVIVGRGPWGNMYEFSIAFAVGVLAGYLLLEHRFAIRSLAFLPLGVALFLAAYAATLPSTIEPLVPALDNAPLLTVHVAMAMIAYGVLAISFAAAVGYLAQGEGDRFDWLPGHDTLDAVAYRSVIIGFPVFASMIVLGSYWASIAWGRYWGWDPKETSALVTWLIYAVYLHARSQRGWAGRPAALILVLGFGAVLFTYFGNLFFSGLHAYSGL